MPSLSAIARTEDERSESEVAAEIGHSQSAERAIARSVTVIALRNPENPSLALLPRLGRLGTGYITRSVVYLETLSCSLSLAFLAEVTGRGYQREGFSGFLRAITVTVDCECPIFARPQFVLSRSDWAIHFPTQTPVGWFHARSLHFIWSEYLSYSTVVLCIWPAGLPEVVTRLVRLIHKCHISDATSVRPIARSYWPTQVSLLCWEVNWPV